MSVSSNNVPIFFPRFHALFLVATLCIIFFLGGVLVPFFISGAYHYTSFDILSRDTVEYLLPSWLSPFGWLIFLLMLLSPALFPVLALLTGILIRPYWRHLRQLEKLVWTSLLIVLVSIAFALWTPTGAAMRTWVLT